MMQQVNNRNLNDSEAVLLLYCSWLSRPVQRNIIMLAYVLYGYAWCNLVLQ